MKAAVRLYHSPVVSPFLRGSPGGDPGGGHAAALPRLVPGKGS